MEKYFFQMMGLRLVLQAPNPLILSERWRPFLCQPMEKADCVIKLHHCPQLPQPEGFWHGPECYLRKDGFFYNFHRLTSGEACFAVTTMDPCGNVDIAVLPQYAHFFTSITEVFNRLNLEILLLRHEAMLLHASMIEYEGAGIAFAGPSGVGKSTQAQLWQTYLGAQLLNGDRAALRREAQGWLAYGSPYAGTSGVYKNGSVPLKAIVVLKQAKENRLTPLSTVQALAALWPELSLPRWDKAASEQAMALLGGLLAQVPVYLLECLPQESAALLLKKGLSL